MTSATLHLSLRQRVRIAVKSIVTLNIPAREDITTITTITDIHTIITTIIIDKKSLFERDFFIFTSKSFGIDTFLGKSAECLDDYRLILLVRNSVPLVRGAKHLYACETLL